MSKEIKITTPLELHDLINKLEDEPGFLVPFMDKADLYLNGCACQAEEYWQQMVHEYRLLKNFDFNIVKEKLQYDVIKLYLEEELIAEV